MVRKLNRAVATPPGEVVHSKQVTVRRPYWPMAGHVHLSPCNASSPPLSRSFTLHWYDLPGFGRSAMRPDRQLSPDVHVDIFALILRCFGFERPIVVTHDFGGAVTWRAQLLPGSDYDQLALANVVAVKPCGSEYFDHVGRPVHAFIGLPPHIHEAAVHPNGNSRQRIGP